MSEKATKTEEELKEEKLTEELEKDEKDGFIPLPEPPEEKGEVEEKPGEKVGEAPPEEVGDKDKKPDQKGEETKPEAFEPTPVEKVEGDEEFVEIVHLGQVHRITKEKFQELAQKGFDYDSKVGPHGKIARMIEADPEIAQMVEDAWIAKAQPKVEPVTIKPLDDYDSEEEWLKDNIRIAVESAVAAVKPTVQPSSPAIEGSPAAQMLMMRDPQHFQMVMAKFPQYANQLSIENYRRIDADPAALCEFYDYVKERETGVPKVDSPKPKPSFKVRSGGGVESRQDNEQQAWNLSNEEFEKQLARIKGYG